MKKIYKYISLCLVALTFASCDNWLDDVPNKSSIDDSVAFDSEENVNLYVNGFYTWLNTYGQFGDRQFSGSWTEAMTDIFKYSGSGLTARAGQPNQYAESAVPMTLDGCLYGVWDNAYSCIRRINQFLVLLEKYGGKYDATLHAQWEAQARFMRGFIYFQLARRHGGVILYDGLPEGPNKALSTEEQTWQFIYDDLKFAADNLPEVWRASDKGRATKYAALAMQSRAMLYAKRWQDAYDAASEVIKSGKYQLVDDYAKAWKGNNSESIIEFDYNKDLGPYTTFDANYAPSTDGSTASCGPAPTQELVESYEKKDGTKMDWTPWHTTTNVRPPYEDLEPRFAATVIYAGSTWKGKVMDCSVNGVNGSFIQYGIQPAAQGNTCSGYFLRKLLDESMTDVVSVKSSQPWVEIRYAEVLLNYAEAAYELGKPAETLDAINQIRARVGLPGKSSSGDQLLQDYRNERKLELAFEGHLFWDMNRWRLCHIAYSNYRRHGIKIENGTYSYVEIDNVDLMFSEKCYILPIPLSEIRNNNLAVQIPSWR